MLTICAALALAGCASQPAVLAPAPVKAPAGVTVQAAFAVKPVTNFGLLGTAQTNRITPNDEEALVAIEVWLAVGDAKSKKLGNVGPLSRQVVVNNLKLDTKYALTLKGFKLDPNASESELQEEFPPTVQMSDDEESTTTFNTNADSGGGYQQFQYVDLTLQLSDQVFSGTTTGNVTVEGGVLESTDKDEALKLPPS
jgi:hypothetical protein